MPYLFVLSIFLLIMAFIRVIRYIRNENRGWKFYKKGYSKIIYFEKIDGLWQNIEIDAKIDYGTFVPCFKNSEDWKEYPDWAQNRKVIIDRIERKYHLKNK